ncbi:SDR family oxidoreductase [Pseudomonas sp. SWRI92]|uniref:SDR family NAD(P)-dependent oxidoreductase n=1 Tax=Pseudomonas sp. SWRI92 TaxID=2745499 RepID=UPI001EE27246|nr:SDR family oxidoreductase [Pseudomonas sp. SWRI92]
MGRRYWLTGAGNGLGESLAEALLKSGARLAISALQSCQALSERYPGQVLAVPGNLTDSQTVREICQQITQQWGALDTVIINAGTAEYVPEQLVDHTVIEHIVRSNLLVASLCIDAALPLLRAGTTPHLVGITSPLTHLPPSRIEAGGNGMRYLFESARVDLAGDGIDVTLVHPAFDIPSPNLDDCFVAPVHWSVETAANHILTRLSDHPQELAFPAAAMTNLWPLPTSTEAGQTDTVSDRARDGYPIKGQP